jgi:hypothetical protein
VNGGPTDGGRTHRIQYLKASIIEDQHKKFGELMESTLGQIESGKFLRHSGIRFPMNGCMSRSHFGPFLENLELIDAKLTTKKKLNHPAVWSLLADPCRI